MKFIYSKQDFSTMQQAQKTCWLLTNGLGGFSSGTLGYGVNRNDFGILMSARTAPNDRVCLVHRVSETLDLGETSVFLSTQEFADGKQPEDGHRHLSTFTWDGCPRWDYDVQGIHVTRFCAMAQGQNAATLIYRVENRGDRPCRLKVIPVFVFASKGAVLTAPQAFHWKGNRLSSGGLTCWVKTDGQFRPTMLSFESLSYPRDAQDGRADTGLGARCCEILLECAPGEEREYEILFSAGPIRTSGRKILLDRQRLWKKRENAGHFHHITARQLAAAAADYISYRQSSNGQTILAGYPFFGDWGRDTMIALPGCVLAREDFPTAKSILRTFLAYEREGLVPNLFPEGDQMPMYNTVDAALLLINSIYLYHRRCPDAAFIQEAFPVLKRIIHAYSKGTRHGIFMDSDGLISAGQGMDQVTWMDVCVEGTLPTPRHGKPVEINAYWYNALRIMERLAPIAGEKGEAYGVQAEITKKAFREQFYLPEGYLKDVISGTEADRQIRCNQIWAVTMPFSMLTSAEEQSVVDTVYRHLYTPCGLRTLSPHDPQFRPTYGGDQKTRDLAYHQGTVWPFPLGAYYLAYLKVNGYSEQARTRVYQQLDALESALREGCVGQLPEIYDGLTPAASQGCFAQAWSVGELLRVYEALEKGNVYDIG